MADGHQIKSQPFAATSLSSLDSAPERSYRRSKPPGRETNGVELATGFWRLWSGISIDTKQLQFSGAKTEAC